MIKTMPKLCQCKRNFISEHLWRIYNKEGEDVQDCLRIIEIILDRDCVCKKKEVCSCKYHDDVCVGAPQRNGVCGICPPNCFKKQSQSPCEHEWQQLFFNMPVNDQPGVVRRIQLPSWGCFKPNCGQVVCKNPNQE
jgi:hypothetical protein